MARSTFYYHLRRIGQEDKYSTLRQRISFLYHLHKGRYGYRRIVLSLLSEGYGVNHKTVGRLMKEMDLKSCVRKVRYRSYKGECGKVAPNVLKRDFTAQGPNRKWATDVTQITIGSKKCYLSPVLDMYNGEIISYTLSERPELKMVMDMFTKALKKVKDTKGLVLHSDQGWHYQHESYRKKLEEYEIIQSMLRKGNCLDNAVMENFFGIMKSELLYLHNWNSLEEFTRELKKYMHYYNYDRIKLKLKGINPVKYRAHSLNYSFNNSV